MSPTPEGTTHAPSAGRVLVTGASRGIGRAVAEALLARGATVGAAGRDRDALGEVAAMAPDRVRVLPVDLADPSARDRLVPRALDTMGGIDALVQSAGIVRYGPLAEMREGDVRALFEVNFFAALTIAQRVAAHFRSRRHGGSIVQVASTLGLRPAPGTGAYAASKAALVSTTRSLAAELAPDGIRVNAVAPGIVDTDMVRGTREESLEELARLHPLGRLGRPEEVAEAIVYLLDAPWTTGTIHVVDGGLLAI